MASKNKSEEPDKSADELEESQQFEPIEDDNQAVADDLEPEIQSTPTNDNDSSTESTTSQTEETVVDPEHQVESELEDETHSSEEERAFQTETTTSSSTPNIQSQQQLHVKPSTGPFWLALFATAGWVSLIFSFSRTTIERSYQ